MSPTPQPNNFAPSSLENLRFLAAAEPHDTLWRVVDITLAALETLQVLPLNEQAPRRIAIAVAAKTVLSNLREFGQKGLTNGDKQQLDCVFDIMERVKSCAETGDNLKSQMDALRLIAAERPKTGEGGKNVSNNDGRVFGMKNGDAGSITFRNDPEKVGGAAGNGSVSDNSNHNGSNQRGSPNNTEFAGNIGPDAGDDSARNKDITGNGYMGTPPNVKTPGNNIPLGDSGTDGNGNTNPTLHSAAFSPAAGNRVVLYSPFSNLTSRSDLGPPPCLDLNGEPVFFASAYMFGGVYPCKVGPHLRHAHVPHNGSEHFHQGRVDVLTYVPRLMELVRTSNNQLPSGRRPVDGGYEADGRKLYHAVGIVRGVRVPGKMGEHLPGAQVSFDGTEHTIRDYNILCWRS